MLRAGMFLILAAFFFFVWVGAFVMFHVAGFMIHLLLILAVVFLVIHFVRRLDRGASRP
jgi:hypothetical protein